MSGTDTLRGLEAAFCAAAPKAAATTWLGPMSDAMGPAGLTTPRRIAAFVGQCAVESDYFTTTEENLNYSHALRLMAVWPYRFPTTDSAAPYVSNPEALANHVYCNRMGNGDEASGDGWRFRGLGVIQITGRDEYQAFADSVGMSIEDAAAWAATPQGAAASAVWFWGWKGCNRAADAWDLVTLTRQINGGLTGLSDRQAACEAALAAINAAV